jgi:uncharacterized damage-inducible protein DinB
MSSSAAALKTQFDLQTRLFNNVLSGISDEDSNDRPSDSANNMKWVAGHLLNTRASLLTQLTGGTPDASYAGQFGRGVSFDPNATYPPIEEIAAKWKETAAAISNGLAHLPEEVLDSKAPTQGPVADESFRGLLAFLISHESYHIGQLSILRKMVGKDAMSYRD